MIPSHCKRHMNILSLGAGVQSTTLALMAKDGLIDTPHCAVFADTGYEPKAVYNHLDWLISVLPYPVHIVCKGNIRADTLSGGRFASIPFHILKRNGETAIGRRQCTKEYKLEPIYKKFAELCGKKRGAKNILVQSMIGISLDECHRMKPSRLAWIENVYPLVDMRMKRNDCIEWLKSNDYPAAPKSACLCCPYHSNATWRNLQDSPEDWADVVDFDKAIRNGKYKYPQYLHRTCVPIDEIDFRTSEEKGQMVLDGFGNECEGMCGL